MKPGSLVVCLKLIVDDEMDIKWLPTMDENTPYVVRNIDRCLVSGREGVTFEEGTIGYTNGIEMIFPIRYVREIQPPCSEEISEICRDAQENYSLIEK